VRYYAFISYNRATPIASSSPTCWRHGLPGTLFAAEAERRKREIGP